MAGSERSAPGFSDAARSIIAGVVASLTYLVAVYALTMPAWQEAYALLPALGAFTGTTLLLPRRPSLTEQLATLEGSESGDATQAADVIHACQARIERLRVARDWLGVDLRERLDSVIRSAQRVVDGFHDDPRDTANAHTFERYLGAAVDIAEKCAQLSGKGDSDAVNQVITRSYRALGDIEAAFGRQYERNLSNDILDLDVDLDVLTQTLKSEEPRP